MHKLGEAMTDLVQVVPVSHRDTRAGMTPARPPRRHTARTNPASLITHRMPTGAV